MSYKDDNPWSDKVDYGIELETEVNTSKHKDVDKNGLDLTDNYTNQPFSSSSISDLNIPPMIDNNISFRRLQNYQYSPIKENSNNNNKLELVEEEEVVIEEEEIDFNLYGINQQENEIDRNIIYDDFNAIDWNFDFTQDRNRKKGLKEFNNWYGQILNLLDSSTTWIVLLLIGVGCGLVAAFIDIVTDWLADIRIGYCSTGFYINQAFCCWGYSDYNNCSEWNYWYSVFGSESYSLKYLIQYSIFLFTAMLFAFLAGYLVKKFAPFASRSGLAEVKSILAGFIIRGFLGKWTLIVKILAVCLSVGSGLTIGKEGPLVHIACCMGNFFLRWFNKYRYNEAKKREILSAAAAAGISVAFGAPIGGVMYSLEEVSFYFPYKIMWRSFFCAMMAAVTLKWVNPFRTGKLVHFQVLYTTNWHGFEMIFFLTLGVIGGLLGALFIKVNIKLNNYYQSSWIKRYPLHLIVAMSLITAAIGFPNKHMRVDAAELLTNLFRECSNEIESDLCSSNKRSVTVVLLLTAGILKLILAMFTYGLDLPAGFYMPAMMIGACLGRVMGILVQAWQKNDPKLFLFASCLGKSDCIAPGTYAMVGAAAMMGGMTRMTVSLVIIMFELTGAISYVLPIMMAVMVSKWVGDGFGSDGLTSLYVKLFGYPYLDQNQSYHHPSTAESAMTKINDLISIPAHGATIEHLQEILNYSNVKGFPIIKSQSDPLLVGYISRSELRAGLNLYLNSNPLEPSTPCLFDILDITALTVMDHQMGFLDLRSWVDPTPITVSQNQPVELVIGLFTSMGLRYVLVTRYGKLLGVITKKDVMRHIDQTTKNHHSD